MARVAQTFGPLLYSTLTPSANVRALEKKLIVTRRVVLIYIQKTGLRLPVDAPIIEKNAANAVLSDASASDEGIVYMYIYNHMDVGCACAGSRLYNVLPGREAFHALDY